MVLNGLRSSRMAPLPQLLSEFVQLITLHLVRIMLAGRESAIGHLLHQATPLEVLSTLLELLLLSKRMPNDHMVINCNGFSCTNHGRHADNRHELYVVFVVRMLGSSHG